MQVCTKKKSLLVCRKSDCRLKVVNTTAAASPLVCLSVNRCVCAHLRSLGDEPPARQGVNEKREKGNKENKTKRGDNSCCVCIILRQRRTDRRGMGAGLMRWKESTWHALFLLLAELMCGWQEGKKNKVGRRRSWQTRHTNSSRRRRIRDSPAQHLWFERAPNKNRLFGAHGSNNWVGVQLDDELIEVWTMCRVTNGYTDTENIGKIRRKVPVLLD